MKTCRRLAWLPILLCFSTVFAQDDTCSAIVREAISIVEDECTLTGRNQACYGYVRLEATPRESVQDFNFAQRGDVVNVGDIDTLRLSALDPASDTWGVALMRLQANLPATLPGQNVTFLIFGNVEIQNAVPDSPALATVEITSGGSINVRSGPSTDNRVIGSLANGDTATANGRNQDGSWLRIQLPDSDALGWVYASLVIPASDVSALSVVDASDTSVPFTPMQAFYFRTGLGDAACAEAPQDGILIQTPAGAGKVQLRANDVDIELGSTAYLQAQAGADMVVSVVEGQGRITSGGTSVSVPAGAQVEIPLDDDLKASGPPGDPHPYDQALVQPLPVRALPDSITIASPATDAQIQALTRRGTTPTGPSAPAAPGGDFSALAGMDPSLICPYLDQALAASGMTRDQYLATLRQAMAFVPADSRAGLEQVEQMITACP
ncbi:MAG: SH3 domain-containing protein [Anaerolineae bacterium]|nr:SH3 domain-containing protein [Anaerolineae bacterium]